MNLTERIRRLVVMIALIIIPFYISASTSFEFDYDNEGPQQVTLCNDKKVTKKESKKARKEEEKRKKEQERAAEPKKEKKPKKSKKEIIKVVEPVHQKSTEAHKKAKGSTLTPAQAYKVLDEVYQGISGFGVGKDEEEVVLKAGGAPTYGEIKYEGWQDIIDDIKPTKKDVFYDLGCGVGKVAMQIYLVTPIKKSTGIELCKKRFVDATIAREKLANKGYIQSGRKLEFVKEDIVKADIKDATIIFMCSTCFGPELMLNIVKQCAGCKAGLTLLSLKQLPEAAAHGFELVKEYNVPMTWMPDGSSVYRYTLVGVSKAKTKKA